MFLHSQSTTVATQAYDYPEWHKGRENYALWYIEIKHPALGAYLNQLRQKFSNFLFHPNTRQFHITIYICGFLTDLSPQFDDDFQFKHLQQHLQDLKKSNLQPFKLKTGKINSFSSALFVDIHDDQNSLSNIKKILSYSTQEIAPTQYCPHITLGLYKAEFPSQQILEEIEMTEQQQFEITIDQLHFGFYKANDLQGKLFDLEYYSLNSNTKKVSLEQNPCCN
ncbi:2'-5' RNA ligase family protein [Acinetobacter bereziniae]|uniref:2'-5' RNA ligase family protein n=1 Tax=Acinetobacter bereziniae TaxID=106648 RepID=UPI00300BACAE